MTKSMVRWTLSGGMALAAVAAATVFGGGAPTADAAPSEIVSTVSDRVGDAHFNAPAFQDVVLGRMTKSSDGDFALVIELAGDVPAHPSLSSPARTEIWWVWSFDLDAAEYPQGYPGPRGLGLESEFIVYVGWDGNDFTATAIDRRPLLTGGAAIVTAVPFEIDGATVRAELARALIGDVPDSFGWGPRTVDWSGPVGSSGGYSAVDGANTVFTP